MGLQWYPRYAGDYIRKTRHLSMLEHGAYNMLLDHYYATGKPIEISNASLLPDHSRVYRLCSAVTKEEKQAVDSVLEMFFELTDEGYINRKAAEVIAKQLAAHERRVNAGRKGGKQSSSNAKPKPKQSSRKPEPEPDILDIYIRGARLDCNMSFEMFWNAYPGNRPKGNKQTARQKYGDVFKELLKDEAQANAFFDAVDAYKAFCESGNYNQHASTWLNQKGWQTDWQAQITKGDDNEKNRHSRARGSKSDRAKAAVARGLHSLPAPAANEE